VKTGDLKAAVKGVHGQPVLPIFAEIRYKISTHISLQSL